MINPVYIFDHVRTPRSIGKKEGELHDITSVQLIETLLRALVKRTSVPSHKIEDVILGCATPAYEQGACIARSAVLAAGYDYSVPGQQINRFCASGLEAVGLAALKVNQGVDFVIGGGVEMMSRVPMGSDGGALAVDPTLAYNHNVIPQGVAADLIATHYGFSKKEADMYAVNSHKKAFEAQKSGYFKENIVPVKDINERIILEKDTIIRPDCSYETVSALKPSFEGIGKQFGFHKKALLQYPHLETIESIHTAGNSSAIADGAGAVLIGKLAAGKKIGLMPKAKIKAFTSVGSEPTMMLSGPIEATKKLLKIAKMTEKDIDLWEINEAFASVVLMMREAFSLDPNKINPCGGSIAMGHPLGATGAMLLGITIEEMIRQNKENALIVLCVAGGMSTGMIIERV